MPEIRSTRERGFEAWFESLLEQRRLAASNVDAAVARIIEDVRHRGDEALIEHTLRLDGADLSERGIRYSRKEIAEIAERTPADVSEALTAAEARIRSFHERQLPEDREWTDDDGATLGWRWRPIDAVGLYVPGGKASYPSSVLMNAVPARVAGVRDVAIAVPTPGGEVNPAVFRAALLAGVETIHPIGGSQAIAAFAFGTESVAPADKIFGPGNAYVAAAKRMVFGIVGIDLIAGPSEVLVIADGNADPEWIAADLLAQAEHDESAQSILITDDESFCRNVRVIAERRLDSLRRRSTAAASWRDRGAIVAVRNMDEAADLSNRIAPEHLQICTRDPDALVPRIRHAGSVFLGSWTPTAIGDYVGGANHVLPTAGTARFASGLSALDFMKRMTVTVLSKDALSNIGPAAATLARSEGLEAHEASVELRIRRLARK